MPIVAPSVWSAARRFCEHLNEVLATTVTQTRLVPVRSRARDIDIEITFRHEGHPIKASLVTRFGPLRLYLGQVCDGISRQDGTVQLRTIRYRYTLGAGDEDDPIFRWEYGPQPPGLYSRHHLQGAVPLQIGRYPLSLNDLHLPTGYVAVEEILRFCISDLGVRPRSGEWNRILSESSLITA